MSDIQKLLGVIGILLRKETQPFPSRWDFGLGPECLFGETGSNPGSRAFPGVSHLLQAPSSTRHSSKEKLEDTGDVQPDSMATLCH